MVTGMFFFRLGDRILTWSTDGAAIVWDAASGALLLELRWGDGCAVRSAGVFAEGERCVCQRARRSERASGGLQTRNGGVFNSVLHQD